MVGALLGGRLGCDKQIAAAACCRKQNINLHMALQAAHHNVGYHESCEPEPAGEALHENESVVVRTLVASRVVHHMSVPRSRVWECRCPWIIHGYPCPESLK